MRYRVSAGHIVPEFVLRDEEVNVWPVSYGYYATHPKLGCGKTRAGTATAIMELLEAHGYTNIKAHQVKFDLERLHPDLLEALRERGWTDEEITCMSPDKAFDEWCGWELGDAGWGRNFRLMNNNLKQAEVKS